MKAKCIKCKTRAGKIPKELPIYCSLKCMESAVLEKHMDYVQCINCEQWMDARYECPDPNCVSKEDE